MTGAPTGPFHLVDAGWVLSFQRQLSGRPWERPTNLGALPYWRMIRGPLGPWVVVPLRDAEALWIAITCGRADGVRGATVGGAVLAISRVIPLSHERRLIRMDAIGRRREAIDRRSVRVVRARSEMLRPALCIAIRSRFRISRVIVTLANPRVFEARSGLRAPASASASDTFSFRRLP